MSLRFQPTYLSVSIWKWVSNCVWNGAYLTIFPTVHAGLVSLFECSREKSSWHREHQRDTKSMDHPSLDQHHQHLQNETLQRQSKRTSAYRQQYVIRANMDHEVIITENARPVCHKPLPPLDPSISPTSTGSILLFYQYIEPEWTKSEHKTSLKKVIEIGTKFNIKGRGRVAKEGLNCTLTGNPNDIRSFCYGLREWNDVFNETDFKITDDVPLDKMFKSLSIRKTNELVAYGLAGGK